MIDIEEQRTLLELAAKAADYKFYGNGKLFWIWKDSNVEWVDWNPLLDDGDSRRLQVALELELRVFNGRAHAGKQDQFWCTETWFPDGDANAATRLAIVRAAAEIGRNMK